MSIPDLNPDRLPSGKLAERPLIELLGIAFAHRRSGRLLLLRGRTQKTIFIYNGIPVNATTSSPGQGILELMVHDHRLAPDDVLQVRKLAESKGMDVERCLRELLEVTESQIYYYRQQAVRAIIIKACGWNDGFYTFEAGDDFMSQIDMYDLNPLDLIYEGINKHRSATLAADLHAIENRVLILNPEKHEYFLLPGPLYDHSDILDIFADGIPVSRAVMALQQEFSDLNLALTTVYLLLLTGLVVFPPKAPDDEIIEAEEIFLRPGEQARAETSAPEPKPEEVMPSDESSVYVISRPRKLKKDRGQPEPPPAPAAKPPKPAKPVSTPPAPEPEPAKPAAPPPPRPRISAPPKPEASAPKPAPEAPPPAPASSSPAPAASASAGNPADPPKRLVILAQDTISAPTWYDALGVTAGADLPELQKNFAHRRRLLVDGLAGDLPADARALLEQAQKRLEEAAATLTDPVRRGQYEKMLAGEEIKRAWNLPMKQALAHRMGERGRWYLLANAPEQSRYFYEQAISLDPESPAYYMELGWVIFRHRPAEAGEARSYLANAVKIDPKLDKAYYYLGVIAKRRDENELAEKMFRRSLELNPGQESARRELAYLNQHQKQTGLWKKIFGG